MKAEIKIPGNDAHIDLETDGIVIRGSMQLLATQKTVPVTIGFRGTGKEGIHATISWDSEGHTTETITDSVELVGDTLNSTFSKPEDDRDWMVQQEARKDDE